MLLQALTAVQDAGDMLQLIGIDAQTLHIIVVLLRSRIYLSGSCISKGLVGLVAYKSYRQLCDR